jgi:hypothetical protein
MRSNFRMSAMLAAACSLVGLIPLSAPEAREPPPVRPDPRPRGPGEEFSRKLAKRAAKREAARIRGGIPGAGLWRKCRAGGRVRGW